MKQGTVKFSKEFITPIGTKEWVGIEYPVDFDSKDEDIYQAYDKVVQMVHNCNARNNPIIQGSSNQWFPPAPYNDPVITSTVNAPFLPVIDKAEERQIGITAEDIMSCQELPILETYKLLVRGKSDLELAYNQRHSQLTGFYESLDDNK